MSEIPINNNPKPPKKGERVMAKDIAELWQAVKRLSAQQERLRPNVFPNPKLAPLTVTLRRIAGDPVTWELFAQYGHVVPRHNASGEAGTPLAITSIPTEDTPLAVVENSKLWVKLTIDEYGKVTDADWETNTTWPTDSPPELIGGDDQTGTAGTRYVRIAQVIANPDSTTTPAQLMVDQLHTGHVDHFQPEICENTTTSPSGGDARVYKTWNASAGRHDFRYLTDGAGITITENTDSIEIKADTGYAFPAAHPWRVTANGDDTVTVGEGSLLSYDEASITLREFLYYDGSYGDITVTGTGSIYGRIEASAAFTPDINYSGIDSNGDTFIVQLLRLFVDSGGTLILSFETTPPLSPNTYFYFEIAKVELVSGDAVVTRQVLTHNPTLASWLEAPP